MENPDAIKIHRTATYSLQLAKQFQEQRAHAEYTDFQIWSGDKVFQCHKNIITSSSPVLRAIVKSDMAEATCGEVHLDNVPADVVQLLLDYMYTGESSILPEQLLPTLKACDYLEMQELKQICLSYSVRNFRPSNVISWFKFAEGTGLDELKTKSAEILSCSFDDVARGQEFLELSIAEVSSYIKDAQETDVDPDNLLDASMRWVNYNSSLRIDSTEHLLKNVPLLACSAECLRDVIERYKAHFDGCPPAREPLANALAVIEKQEGRMQRRKKKINSRLIVIGGHNNDICWELLDKLDSSMQFVELCKIPERPFLYSVCQTAEGFVVSGGQGLATCSMFIFSTNAWVPLENLPEARSQHGSVCLLGRVLVFGGIIQYRFSSSVQSLQLNEAVGKWIDEPDLPIRPNTPLLACIDRNIFLLDGVGSNELFCMDVDRKTWGRRQSMEDWCDGAGMVAVKGKLLVAGGNYKTFACYNSATDTWSSLQSPLLAHADAALVHHQQKLYLLGGNDEDRVEEYSVEEEMSEAAESWHLSDFTVPHKSGNLHAVSLVVYI